MSEQILIPWEEIIDGPYQEAVPTERPLPKCPRRKDFELVGELQLRCGITLKTQEVYFEKTIEGVTMAPTNCFGGCCYVYCIGNMIREFSTLEDLKKFLKECKVIE